MNGSRISPGSLIGAAHVTQAERAVHGRASGVQYGSGGLIAWAGDALPPLGCGVD
jgi:hypothetical protein